MGAAYGDKFGCQIPGIEVAEDLRMPVCQHFFTTNKGPRGLEELLACFISQKTE